MAQALIFGIIFIALVIVIFVLGFTAPKLLSRILIVGSFVGIVIVFICVDSSLKGLVEGIAAGGFIAFVIWIRFKMKSVSDERVLSQVKGRLSRSDISICKKCGTKLTYHRTPKNFNQLLFGGLSCPNCGAEVDVPFDAFIKSRES
jgi:hypothetical protein